MITDEPSRGAAIFLLAARGVTGIVGGRRFAAPLEVPSTVAGRRIRT
jgi:hypothetical protein